MTSNNNQCYEFGPYQLDPSKRILTRDGEGIPLTPKATEILIVLVRHAGQLVEKDELLKEVWPDTFVEEANLSQNIFTLRRALGDDRTGPKYIETVAKRGYRFLASVRAVPPAGSVASSQASGAASQSPVIAVLPFINNTGDPELEYLADGLTSNVINNLSRISQLRVMSRSTVFRYKLKDEDPQQAGKELDVDAVLVGKIHASHVDVSISVELVEVATGWQLWGESFELQSKHLLEIQDAIVRHALTALKLKLTGSDEANRLTARYTRNSGAYQAYLEGRCHWGTHTQIGIVRAIKIFRHAIDLDPNYALAYAAIVDCYLRLATTYLQPNGDVELSAVKTDHSKGPQCVNETDPLIKIRFEWDWKAAERELRRANDMRTNYPASYQWYFAYLKCKQLYHDLRSSEHQTNRARNKTTPTELSEQLPPQIPSLELTLNEQLQILCIIVREQIDVGNYEAGCKLLQQWWSFGNWPKLDGLTQPMCADVLFTAGKLAGFVASTIQLPRGQKHGEELLNGSVALFGQLGLFQQASEARIELALCYHRQGLLDIARSTLIRVIGDLPTDDEGLRSLALMRLAGVERNAGRLKDALNQINQSIEIATQCGPWLTARCYLELASIHKDLAISERDTFHYDKAKHLYSEALYEFERVGHHRYAAAVENNMGLLLLSLGSYPESEGHLLCARKSFETLSDKFREAQVNETLARLYVETGQYERAQENIEQAVAVFEIADSEAILAESLITNAIVASRLGKVNDAKRGFEGAHAILRRCSDNEGAGLALLIMIEELGENLETVEKIQLAATLQSLLSMTQQKSIHVRVKDFIAKITSASSRGGDNELED